LNIKLAESAKNLNLKLSKSAKNLNLKLAESAKNIVYLSSNQFNKKILEI
jgi:hypothetical protein